MADVVKIGNVKVPKQALLIGGAATAGIIFYAYYARGSGGSGGASEAPVDPNAGIDPFTGLPYADQFGFGEGGYSGIGVYDPSTGGTIGGGYGNQIVTGNTTNAMWTQAAILYLSGVGYEGTVVSDAIGKVLVGRPVTTTELNIFNAARAVQGEPPQPYPPVQMVSGAPPGTTNPSGTSLPKPGNLHVIAKGGTGRNRWVRVDWNGVTGAKQYEVWMIQDNPGGDTPHSIIRKNTITTDAQLGGLWENRRYRISVHPIGQDGGRGAKAEVFYTTPKK